MKTTFKYKNKRLTLEKSTYESNNATALLVKDCTTIEAYECFGSHACREPVVTTCDCTDTAFHNAYLRLTGYTESEYREKLKQESPTVYAARVKAGIYQEA